MWPIAAGVAEPETEVSFGDAVHCLVSPQIVHGAVTSTHRV